MCLPEVKPIAVQWPLMENISCLKHRLPGDVVMWLGEVTQKMLQPAIAAQEQPFLLLFWLLLSKHGRQQPSCSSSWNKGFSTSRTEELSLALEIHHRPFLSVFRDISGKFGKQTNQTSPWAEQNSGTRPLLMSVLRCEVADYPCV